MVPLYVDEDGMDRGLVRALRSGSVDVLTAHEAGMIEQPDHTHLAHAASLGRALYSYNVGDYCRLHGEWVAFQRTHAGIILARQQVYSVGEQARRLVRILSQVPAYELAGQVVFLGAWG
jgi:hypothetical protein